MADWYVSSAAWTAIAQFAASTAYTVGQIVRPLTAPAVTAQYAFRCTTAGTSSTEPSWPTGNNATVTTGGATFTNVAGQSTYGWTAALGNLQTISSSGGARTVNGDRIFVSSDHAETSTATLLTLLGAGGPNGYGLLQVISVNRAGSVPPVAADQTSGAALTFTGAGITLDVGASAYWQGLTFTLTGAGAFAFNNGGTREHYLRNCSIVLGASATRLSNNNPCKLVLDTTNVQFNAAGQVVAPTFGALETVWLGASISGTAPTTLFPSSAQTTHTLRGTDTSTLTTTLYSAGGGNYTKVLLDSCRIASGMSRYSAAPGTGAIDEVELVNCYDGTSILSERHTPAGDLTTNRTITLVGGAQDDVGLFSHQMVSSTRSDFLAMALDSFWMDVENTLVGAAHVATVEVLGLAALNNTDISLVLEYLGTGGTSVASFASSLPQALTASAALPTSPAAWNVPPLNYFNPAANVNFSYTNSNLTVAATTSGDQTARVQNAFTSGKVYFEVTMNVAGGTNNWKVGIVNANKTLTTWIGSDGNGIDYQGNGMIQTGGSTVTTLATWGASAVICVAVDYANQKVWFRLNGGNWDNTTDNPATNTGGYSLTTIISNNANLYAAVGVYNNGDQFTANFGGSAFAQAVPAGFVGLAATFPQRLQVAFTPQQAGRLRGLVRLGRPSTTVYVNPQITVT